MTKDRLSDTNKDKPSQPAADETPHARPGDPADRRISELEESVAALQKNLYEARRNLSNTQAVLGVTLKTLLGVLGNPEALSIDPAVAKGLHSSLSVCDQTLAESLQS